MSQGNVPNVKSIFGALLRPAPFRTYSRKGKHRPSDNSPTVEPIPHQSKRKASSDPSALQVSKKILKDVSTQWKPLTEHSPRITVMEEEQQVFQYEKHSQASVHMDNEISFLPEYIDPEEESSDDSDGIFDVQHISPRRASSSSKSTSPHLAVPDEVEEIPETNSGQGGEKKPALVSYHDHTRRPGRPFLHQYKGLRRRPYLIFNRTPSHRLKDLPKSEKKRSIFASRANLGDGFSDNEAKHSGLVLLTRNGRHSGSGPNFEPLDVTQSRSPKAKGKATEENVRSKRKSRRTGRDDNSFEPLPKKQKKTTERENSKATKQHKQQTPVQENPSSEITIVNSNVLDLAKEQDQTVETFAKVTNKEAGDDTTPQDNTRETEALETSPTEEQDQPHPPSDESVKFVIPNSDDMNLLPAHTPRHAIGAGPKPSCSWETYIPESSDMGRASSVPAPTRLSHAKEASKVNPAEEQRPSSPSLPLLPGNLKEQVSFSLDTKSRAPLHRTLRRINTQ